MAARILLTGASGFVGRALLPAINAAFPDSILQPFIGDIAQRSAVSAAIEQTRADIVIHLAAIAAVPQAQRDLTRCFDVNLTGTLNLADEMLVHTPRAWLIYFGSGDCYGASFKSGRPVAETTPLAPLNSYAASKSAADLTLGALAAERGLRLLRLRPFNQIGPAMPESYAMGSFAAQLKRIQAGAAPPILEVGNLDAERDMVHVDDVAAAVVRALTLIEAGKLPDNLVLNLASGQPRRIGSMLDDLIARSGLAVTIKADPARMRPSDIPRAVGDAHAARQTLNWEAKIPYQKWLSDLLKPNAKLP
ncbi:MAG TPA: NAD-dependent epimerase/dehydratase family protein [Acidiphilium sp.]|nr:NAD-dependent epimerase/dehydratase family protein [Acidiphilium sp.]HQU23650.1 NAD-dependent epimerase/dehydratase family protein [Acidiphilium sp.]